MLIQILYDRVLRSCRPNTVKWLRRISGKTLTRAFEQCGEMRDQEEVARSVSHLAYLV